MMFFPLSRAGLNRSHTYGVVEYAVNPICVFFSTKMIMMVKERQDLNSEGFLDGRSRTHGCYIEVLSETEFIANFRLSATLCIMFLARH